MTDPLAIPTTPGEPHYTQRTRLDGKDYNLEFLWNVREARWYLSLSDDAGTLILAGLKLMTNVGLLAAYHADPNVPPGELAVVSKVSTAPAGLYELGLGLRCELTYFPIA